jgi:hypothetical protein
MKNQSSHDSLFIKKKKGNARLYCSINHSVFETSNQANCVVRQFGILIIQVYISKIIVLQYVVILNDVSIKYFPLNKKTFLQKTITVIKYSLNFQLKNHLIILSRMLFVGIIIGFLMFVGNKPAYATQRENSSYGITSTSARQSE